MPTLSQNQKIAAVFTLSSLAAIGIFFSLQGIRNAGERDTLPSAQNQVAAVSVDADDDGLLDKEELGTFRTDPKNPDTDGDGLLDGLEVALGNDPLQSDIAEAAGRIAAAEARGETNATTIFLEELFSSVAQKAYLYAPEGEEPELHPGLGPTDIEQLISVLQGPFASLVPQVTIRDEEIRFSGNASRDAIVAYIREVSETIELAFQASGIAPRTTPLQVLMRQLTENLLPGLEASDKKLSNLAVPKSFGDLHKELLQLVRLEVSILQKLKGQQDDILASYISFSLFSKTTDGWVNLRDKVASRLKAERITLPADLAAKLLLPAAS